MLLFVENKCILAEPTARRWEWLLHNAADSGWSRNEERPPERLKEGPVGTSGPASFDGRSHARGRLFDLERGQEDRGIKGRASALG